MVDCCAMEIVREDRKAKQSITDIQYNMLGDFLALGCSDGRIYLHSGIDYELLRTIEIPERSCGIAFLDFSLDSKYLRVSTDDSQLYVFTISGSQVSSPMEIRDLVWLKQTCPYSWATQGIGVNDRFSISSDY